MIRRPNRLKHVGAPIPTFGQVLPDGTILDLIGTPAAGACRLLVWNGREAFATTRFNWNGQLYVPAVLDPTILEAVRFPSGIAPSGPTRELFDAICHHFETGGELPTESAHFLSASAMSSWFPELIAPAFLISLHGPIPSDGLRVLNLLSCFSRRPLILGELSEEGLSPSLMQLSPTLLIHQGQQSMKSVRLLQCLNSPGTWMPRGGRLRRMHGAAVIYTTEPLRNAALRNAAIQVRINPSSRSLSVLRESQINEIAREFQPKLEMYRLQNFQKVRDATFPVTGLSSCSRDLAHALCSAIVDDPELQSKLLSLLCDRDMDLRAAINDGVESTVVESLLFLCHDGRRKSVAVKDVAGVLNTIRKARGEVFGLSPEETGHRLSDLGVRRRTRSTARQVVLDDANRRYIHKLAINLGIEIPKGQRGDCRYCHDPGELASRLQDIDMKRVV